MHEPEPHGNGIWTGIARVGWCILALAGLMVPVAVLATFSWDEILAGSVGVLIVAVALAAGVR